MPHSTATTHYPGLRKPSAYTTSVPVDGDVMRVNKLAVFALFLALGLAVLAIVAVKPWKRDN